jgi:hypothetical protein
VARRVVFRLALAEIRSTTLLPFLLLEHLCFPTASVPFFLCFIVLPEYEGFAAWPTAAPSNELPSLPSQAVWISSPSPQSGIECVTTDCPAPRGHPTTCSNGRGHSPANPHPVCVRPWREKKTEQRTRHCFFFSVVLYCHTCTLIPTIRNATYAPLKIINTNQMANDLSFQRKQPYFASLPGKSSGLTLRVHVKSFRSSFGM